jgi:hypothetical protein
MSQLAERLLHAPQHTHSRVTTRMHVSWAHASLSTDALGQSLLHICWPTTPAQIHRLDVTHECVPHGAQGCWRTAVRTCLQQQDPWTQRATS